MEVLKPVDLPICKHYHQEVFVTKEGVWQQICKRCGNILYEVKK